MHEFEALLFSDCVSLRKRHQTGELAVRFQPMPATCSIHHEVMQRFAPELTPRSVSLI